MDPVALTIGVVLFLAAGWFVLKPFRTKAGSWRAAAKHQRNHHLREFIVMRHDNRLGQQSEGFPPAIDPRHTRFQRKLRHVAAHDHRTRAASGNHTAAIKHFTHGSPGRCVDQCLPQIIRFAPGEVDQVCRADPSSLRWIVTGRSIEQHKTIGLSAQSREMIDAHCDPAFGYAGSIGR